MMTWTLDRLGHALRAHLQPSAVTVGQRCRLGAVSTDTRTIGAWRHLRGAARRAVRWPRLPCPGGAARARRRWWSTIRRARPASAFPVFAVRDTTRALGALGTWWRDHLGRDRRRRRWLQRQDDHEGADPVGAGRCPRRLRHHRKPQQPGRRAADAPSDPVERRRRRGGGRHQRSRRSRNAAATSSRLTCRW